jgi:hypothetical protein
MFSIWNLLDEAITCTPQTCPRILPKIFIVVFLILSFATVVSMPSGKVISVSTTVLGVIY